MKRPAQRKLVALAVAASLAPMPALSASDAERIEQLERRKV